MSIIDVVKDKLSRGQVIFRKPTIEQLIAHCDNVIIESEHEGRMAKQYHDMCGEIAQDRDALREDKHKAVSLMQSWMALYDDAKAAYTKYKIERDALKAENERMRKALEYYANKDNWYIGIELVEWIGGDGGDIAREALKGKQ
jgi:uncharacterized coiled-coil DUF342 family protein